MPLTAVFISFAPPKETNQRKGSSGDTPKNPSAVTCPSHSTPFRFVGLQTDGCKGLAFGRLEKE